MTRHPLDGNAIAADAHYDRPEVGTEDGDTCNRWQEPDEDCPKPWRCRGAMEIDVCGCCVRCGTCGEYVTLAADEATLTEKGLV